MLEELSLVPETGVDAALHVSLGLLERHFRQCLLELLDLARFEGFLQYQWQAFQYLDWV